MAALNYAKQYSQALAQAYPYVLHFGALFNSPNNKLYKVTGAKTIEIPVMTTKGRKDGDRDTIGSFSRNHDNTWEPKVLSNHREWDTLIHPVDVDQTNYVASIQNATRVFNETQKFPEMDAYLVSKVYADWLGQGKTADTTALTVDNILIKVDALMEKMDEARVPQTGRILYVTPAINTLIKNAKEIQRIVNVGDGGQAINRNVSRIDELIIEKVPSDLMKTAYNFTQGWAPATTAKQIHMFMVHPTAVLTPINYTFANLDVPSAKTKGKYLYFEESFEDVFILNQRKVAIEFIVEGGE